MPRPLRFFLVVDFEKPLASIGDGIEDFQELFLESDRQIIKVNGWCGVGVGASVGSEVKHFAVCFGFVSLVFLVCFRVKFLIFPPFH